MRTKLEKEEEEFINAAWELVKLINKLPTTVHREAAIDFLGNLLSTNVNLQLEGATAPTTETPQ